MKNLISVILTHIIRPFYGSGLGTIFPFRQLNQFYVSISQGREQLITTSSGFKMLIQYGKYIDNTLLSTGTWEPNITQLIKNTLSAGDTFIDVGANIGYDSLLASTIVGENGTVLAFEPADMNYTRLKKNIEINKFDNIQYFQVGLGDRNIDTEIYIDSINPGAASVLSARKDDEGINKSKIKIRVFDEMFPGQKCTLLKMDIEGYELEALKGMRELLKNNDLKIILEYSPILYNKVDPTEVLSRELLSFIESFGFCIHHIHEDGSYTPIVSIDEYYNRVKKDGGQSDIYCQRY